MKYDWEFFKSYIKSVQKDKRFLHTLGVADEAISLGKIFLPKKLEKLYFTGLLHDITKDFSTEKHLELCSKYSIEISPDIAPKLLHSKTGAAYARDKFGEDYIDSEVYNAIFRHTTGSVNMSIFDIIIYLADYIEQGRTFEDCVYLRKFFYDRIKKANTKEERLEVLRKALVLSFDLTIKNLIDEGKSIDSDTINSRNYFLNNKIKTEE
ncbi:MAG: bis(5'-nucleosyl)-tetraphosphatase (symmetrical) YqeK [Clostridia bacterium]|nr:bis(5'-nucleosyl)-tetraphosphatase (symmetrical) YqeK [Clostridia bacterium]